MRIYASDNSVHDFCDNCMPTEDQAVALFNDFGDGPDGRGNCFDYDSDHPPYDDTDYCCEKCGIKLEEPIHTNWVSYMLAGK